MTKKGRRGIPDSINQVEVERREDQLKVCGTEKISVIEGYQGCPNIVASSIYDMKTVHYLSMVTQELNWILK